ncbi:hypothetical protein BV898_09535 [Hypsibius exemplaris]|uniref:PR domain zinc finger protein 10 n=1 Tax=Hypsibius exemplaris TaxID=2072580 RepID=A0A1W0WMI9_HYPEX|nr:hypothetical protein BV898_09535 [Hypsibius exemplaris]
MASLSRAKQKTQNFWCLTCNALCLGGPCVLHTRKMQDQTVITRAFATVPKGLKISLDLEGQGHVFAEQSILPPTIFGPLDAGLTVNPPLRYDYALYSDESVLYYDTSLDLQCNWMKFVRVSEAGHNLLAFQQQGCVYFNAIKEIKAREELVVWYAEDYGKAIGKVRLVPEAINRVESSSTKTTVITRSGAGRTASVSAAAVLKLFAADGGFAQKKTRKGFSYSIAPGMDQSISGDSSHFDPDYDISSGLPDDYESDGDSDADATVDLQLDSSSQTTPIPGHETGSSSSSSSQQQQQVPDSPPNSPPKRKRAMCFVSYSGQPTKRKHGRVATCEPPSQPPAPPRYFQIRDNFYHVPCDQCPKVFHSRKMLEMHAVLHGAMVESDGSKTCPWCALTVLTTMELAVHVDEHAKPQPIQRELACRFCDHRPPTSARLASHMKSRHPKEDDDRVVKNGTKEIAAVNAPKRSHHKKKLIAQPVKSDSTRTIQCLFCKVNFPHTFEGYRERTHHVERHRSADGSFVCPLCRKPFSEHRHVLRHAKDQHKPKDWVCAVPGCGKAFYRQKHLKSHMVTHESEYRAVCGSCGRKFKRSRTRDDHFMALHGENREDYGYRERSVRIAKAMADALVCQYCYKQYIGEERLLQHHRDQHIELLSAEMRERVAFLPPKRRKNRK